MQKKHFFILFFWVISLKYLISQSVHAPYINYSSEDGLPSSECYYIMQDHDGFMWISTDNGLSKFDGYKFTNYGVEHGLKDQVVFDLQEDKEGRIWMNTLSNKLYFLTCERDSIYPFYYQSIIDSFSRNVNRQMFFYFSNLKNHLYVYIPNTVILEFYQDGFYDVFTCPFENTYCYMENFEFSALLGKKDNNVKCNLISYDYKNHIFLKDLGEHLFYTQFNPAFKKYKNGNIINLGEKCYFMNKDTCFSIDIKYRVQTILNYQNEILVTYLGKGLWQYKNGEEFLKKNGNPLLDFELLTSSYLDSNQNIWSTSLDRGILLFREASSKNIEYIDHQYRKSKVTKLRFLKKDKLIVIHESGKNYILDLTKLKFENYEQDLSFRDILVIKNETFISNGLKYLNRYSNHKFTQIANLSPVNAMITDCNGALWLAQNSSVTQIKTNNSNEMLKINSPRSNGLFIDHQNTLWNATIDGLFYLKDSSFVSAKTIHPTLKLRIDSVKETKDSTLIIGTKGAGIILWKNESFIEINKNVGLTSNNVENINIDSFGNIWVGTLEGLNKISKNINNKYVVKKFTIENGLPSNEVNDVAFYNDLILVATNNGLYVFKEKNINPNSIPPIIISSSMNDNQFPYFENTEFNYNNNNLKVNYLTLNYKQNGKINYQFRVNHEEWNQTTNTSIDFINLAPGNYLLEIRSQNEDGIWSNATPMSFVINKPWWQNILFRVIFLLGIIGVIFTIIKVRERRIKLQSKLKLDIINLEQSALAAQMNPHFIFNCLNSIQLFIMKNNKMEAMEYLSKFAILIRFNLNASVERKISLHDEIKLLTSYLDLEKLRKEFSFDYQIQKEDDLDEEQIFLPPLIIQPFVENAILHGLKDVKDGFIQVLFSSVPNGINVKIIDNGKGMNTAQEGQSGHKSLGSSITNKRLSMIHKNENYKVMVTSKLSEGTCIDLTIPLMDYHL